MSLKQPPTFVKVAEPFLCGGAAASFASIVIHPIDLAKVCRCMKRMSVIKTNMFIDLIETTMRYFRSECSCMVN